MRKSRLVAAVLAAVILLAACGSAAVPGTGSSGAGGAPPCKPSSAAPLTFADTQFQTLWINNAIAEYIIQHGYCNPVKSITMSTPIMEKSLADGQVDVMMELWRVNIIDWYNQATKSGKIVDLGRTYDASTQGWYVPKYVISGDAKRGIKASAPGLKSVSDLAKYWQVFKDPNNPSKGLLVNCIGAWQCNKVNRIKLHAYGLAKYYDTMDPGSPAALDAAIVGAYKKGQPVLAYYWGPTWLLGQYDMVQLKEPKYTKSCNAEIQTLLKNSASINNAPKSAGCAYQTYGIHKGVTASVIKKYPKVVAFLKKMNVHNQPLDKTAAYMQTNKADAETAAVYFLTHYAKEWEGWVPGTVAERVKAALKAQGAHISS